MKKVRTHYEEIIKIYNGGGTLSGLASKFKVGVASIKKILIENNIP